MDSRVTCAARAKAAATAPASPWWKSTTWLPGTSSWSSGAPGAAAARASVTAGSGSMSGATASAASRACCAVSATTMATGSPTKRTLPVVITGWVGTRAALPSRFFWATETGMGPTPAASRSRPVRMASTPGIAAAPPVSIPFRTPWA